MHRVNEIGPLQKRVLFSSFTGWMFDGFETCALIGPHICAIAARQGLALASWANISAVVDNVGSIYGYIAGGFLADAIGRKPYMYGMFIGAILSGVLVYLAPQSLAGALASVFVLGAFTLGVFSWMPIYLLFLQCSRRPKGSLFPN